MQLLGIIIMQAITMFQPEALLETKGSGRIVSVEMARQETRVRLHREDSQTLPPGTYLSDEADRHYALQRIEREDSDRVYVFAPMPTTTRIFDIIADRYRWMGVHSAIRALRFPAVREGDDIGTIPDSIEINVPLYREYVVWKWKTSEERSLPPISGTTLTEPQRPRRRNLFQRLFGRSHRTENPAPPGAPQQKPRPLSRFEQKMLQESRTRGN